MSDTQDFFAMPKWAATEKSIVTQSGTLPAESDLLIRAALAVTPETPPTKGGLVEYLTAAPKRKYTRKPK